MTGISLSSADLDDRRKKILFRSWRRGTREMDLLVGRFAEAHLLTFSDAELSIFEALIEVPDKDLYPWVAGKLEVPGNYNTSVFRQLLLFAAETAGADI
jgi:antitoxin CptB